MFIKLHSFLAGRCVCVGADGSSSGRSASCSRAAAAADRGTKKTDVYVHAERFNFTGAPVFHI